MNPATIWLSTESPSAPDLSEVLMTVAILLMIFGIQDLIQVVSKMIRERRARQQR